MNTCRFLNHAGEYGMNTCMGDGVAHTRWSIVRIHAGKRGIGVIYAGESGANSELVEGSEAAVNQA